MTGEIARGQADNSPDEITRCAVCEHAVDTPPATTDREAPTVCRGCYDAARDADGPITGGLPTSTAGVAPDFWIATREDP